MAGSKHCYSAYSKSRGTKASKRSLIKRTKSFTWPVHRDLTIDNRTFFETTLALCRTDEEVRKKVVSAFAKTADAGPGTRVVIQPWAPADGYASSSSEEDDDEKILRLLDPRTFDEEVEEYMKVELARRARDRARVEEIRKEMAARERERVEEIRKEMEAKQVHTILPY